MRPLRLSSVFAAAAIAAPMLAAPALAQTAIGLAERSEPNVTGILGARRASIVQGASVHQNEVIQTNAGGSTMLQFKDSTILAIGPNASVKLDRFVYNPDATARQAVISLTRGSFRWVTGASNPNAFRITTPHATIGIRGTIVEFGVTAAITSINLIQGAINVCSRLRNECFDMAEGATATVGAAGVSVTAAAPAERSGGDRSLGGGAGYGGESSSSHSSSSSGGSSSGGSSSGGSSSGGSSSGGSAGGGTGGASSSQGGSSTGGGT